MMKGSGVYELRELKLDKYNLKINETLFHNANGYIGIRYDFEEGYEKRYSREDQFVPSQYINGFYEYLEINQAEKLYGLVEEKQIMLNIANTQSIKIFLDGEEFSMFSGTILAGRLCLDMERGITVRNVAWRSPKGKEVYIAITRMASFHQLSLFTIEYEVLPQNFSGDILIESSHNGNVLNYADPEDPRISDEVIHCLKPLSCQIKDEVTYITSRTSKSDLEVCTCVKNVLCQGHQKEFIIDNNNATCRFHTTAKQGKKIRLIKYAVFCDSIRNENCRSKAELEMARALSVPLEYLYERQEEYLADYWNNCGIEIEGDEELNSAMRFNLYQLIQSVGKDRYCNVAPKGLSGDGYEGHYFWDSEMYIQPFFTMVSSFVFFSPKSNY